MEKMSKKWILVCGIIVLVIAAACLYGIFRTGSNVHMQEAETEQTPEPEEDLDSAGETMPKIIDAIADEEKVTALCEDGSVWSWDRESGEKSAVRVEGFRDVKKIMHAGSAVYALSEDGHVYVWGNDYCLQAYKEKLEDYKEVQEIPELMNIVDMDVNVDPCDEETRAFAVDSEGNLYVWGLFLYRNWSEDYIPVLLNENRELGEGVVSVFAGAGRYHYFIRADGTVFSIMDEIGSTFGLQEEMGAYAFIFPVFPMMEEEPAEKPLVLEDVAYSDIRRESNVRMGGFTIQYELGSDREITCIDADKCTVFMARDDNSLWYWNSRMISFHDWMDAQIDPVSRRQDYSGNWERVTAGQVAGMAEGDGEDLAVADICAGRDNTIFLMENGQVFVSEYVTYDIKDVEYYYCGGDPLRHGRERICDLNLKELSFRKLDWENIVSINTDGTYYFTAVDADGECFYLDMEPEE